MALTFDNFRSGGQKVERSGIPHQAYSGAGEGRESRKATAPKQSLVLGKNFCPPSLARPKPKGEGGLFRRRRISCQLKTGAPPKII